MEHKRLRLGISQDEDQAKNMVYKVNYLDNEKYTISMGNFDADYVKLKLELYGVCVIEGVISEDICDDIYKRTKQTVSNMTQKWDTPIDFDDYKTINMSHLSKHHQLIQESSIGQIREAWELRSNANVMTVFAGIHNCKEDDLISSTDAISLFAYDVTKCNKEFKHPVNAAEVERKYWFHSDQSYTGTAKPYIQSWVTMLDTEANQSTFGFFESSHIHHGEYFEKFGKRIENIKANWNKINAEEIEWYLQQQQCQMKGITCKKGAMVLWKSETIHCGLPPTTSTSEYKNRCVYYICQVPRQWATVDQLARKRKYVIKGRTTTHQPDQFGLFGTKMRFGKKECPIEYPIVDAADLTDIQKRLAGFDNEHQFQILYKEYNK